MEAEWRRLVVEDDDEDRKDYNSSQVWWSQVMFYFVYEKQDLEA